MAHDGGPVPQPKSVDPDVDEEYDPSLTPFPEQRCQECHHRADVHGWQFVPEDELAKPYEKSARRLVCRDCRRLRRNACVLIAETTLVPSHPRGKHR